MTLSVENEPFVGRESELSELTAALEDALSGRGSVAVIAGEPGIGKTGISEELERVAVDRGANVLWGRCYEESGAPPYWPWVQAIRSYIRDADANLLQSEMGPGAAEIAEIVPELRESLPGLLAPSLSEDSNAARFRLFDSLASWLRNASDNQALVLILEDLHAADGDSLLLLEFVARELADTNLMIVGTYRDVELGRHHPLSRTLTELRRSNRFRRMLLRRLDHTAVLEFVTLTLGELPPPGFAESIYAETEGNPLYVTEILRFMRQEGRLSPESLKDFGPDDLPLPEGVREAIGRHLDRLSEKCNELLTVAAILGRQFEFRHLALLTSNPLPDNRLQLSEVELADLLDEAVEARVLEEVSAPDVEYQFTHVLIKETLTDEMSNTRQARMHASVALMLEDFFGKQPARQAAQLAFHFGRAENVLGVEKFIHYSLLAGTQSLATYAHEAAIVQFQRGLSAKEGQPDDLDTAELLRGLGVAQLGSMIWGDPDDPIRSIKRSFDIYIEAGMNDRALAIAEGLFVGNDSSNTVGQDLFAKAVELAPKNSPTAALTLAKYGSAKALTLNEFGDARNALTDAIEIAENLGDSMLQARVLFEQIQVELWSLEMKTVSELANHAISLFDPETEKLTGSRILFYNSVSSFFTGNPDIAKGHARAARDLAVEVQDLGMASSCAWIEAAVAGYTGDWPASIAIANDSLRTNGPDPRIFGIAAKAQAEIGNHEAVEDLVRKFDKYAYGFGSKPTVPRIHAIADPVVAAYTSKYYSDIVRRKKYAFETAQEPTIAPFAEHVNVFAQALIAVIEDDAEAAADLMTEIVRFGSIMSYVGQSDRIAGLTARTAGEFDLATAHFERSLEFLAKAGYAAETAWVQHEYADSLNRRNDSGDVAKATELNGEAIILAEKFGMKPLLERAQVLQGDIDATPAKPAGAPAGLSRRELDVIRLVAAGKSNPEIAETLFISLNTVTHHMTNIFNKTGSANRAEAAAFAIRNGIA